MTTHASSFVLWTLSPKPETLNPASMCLNQLQQLAGLQRPNPGGLEVSEAGGCLEGPGKFFWRCLGGGLELLQALLAPEVLEGPGMASPAASLSWGGNSGRRPKPYQAVVWVVACDVSQRVGFLKKAQLRWLLGQHPRGSLGAG